jgi:hypothetical protein
VPVTPPAAAATPTPEPAPPAAPEQPPAAAPQTPAAPAPPTPPPSPTARVAVTTPGPQFEVGGGPYTVPLTIAGAQRVATISLSITYNPSVLRVRAVQAGTFMAQGGVTPTFTQQVDPGAGRVDVTVLRPGDQVGASGTGLLATLVLEAIAPGQSAITPSGVAANPEQGAVGLQLVPAAVTVK